MTSVLSSATQTAHSIAASLLSNSPIKPGGTIPSQDVKEDSAEHSAPLTLKGKNIILGVPGAFTDTCTAEVPQYIENYQKFKDKGVNNIYVIAINDVFVMKAWKKSMAHQDTPIRFIADDIGTFTGSVGLMLDASKLLGGPRSKRYVIVANDDKVETVVVEEDPTKYTVTAAQAVLAQL
ncbi:hypothetical protein AX17_002428 [Amanita inopinata Kibby_2008]|nr:hypothetical protein AX17_002428 [Amanita inopinata Kibby_2008]